MKTDRNGRLLVYRGGEWYEQKLIPLRFPLVDERSYKKEGVYVIIGGAGGIGEVWSEYMIRNYNAKVVWIGRRKKNAEIRTKLDKLSGFGQVPLYISADATDLKSLEDAYQKIKEHHYHINGVIHSAIVLMDMSLFNMSEDRFKDVLSAKVDVSVRLAQVFQKEKLDFVLFFSSMQSFFKAPGQSNYAAGCTFKDAFANQLSKEWPCSVKIINWGYWGNVGVVSSKAYQDRMAQMGIGSIEPPEAMKILETLLYRPIMQTVFMKTI